MVKELTKRARTDVHNSRTEGQNEMNRRNLIAAAIAMCTIVGSHVHVQAQTKNLNVPQYGQQTNMWCWAASGEMIMTYLGKAVAQCAEANQLFGMKNCCNSPTPSACAKGGWPQWPAWGFSASDTTWGKALTFAQLKGQIDSNKPVGFSWGWTGGGGHYMVVRGYTLIGTSQYVIINDPWPWNPNKLKGGGTRTISYAEYVSVAGNHVHWKDQYNITKN